MKLRFKYKIYPTKLQEFNLIQAAGNARFIYNYFLEQNIKQYQIDKTFVFYNEMSKRLTELKKQLDWLSLSYSQSLQAKLKDLDAAFKNFLRRLKLVKQGLLKIDEVGFPKFKSKWNKNDAFRYVQNVEFVEEKLRLPKIGDVKIKLHRPLPSKPSSTSVFREGKNWYVSFVVEKQELNLIDKDKISSVIGIDVNSDFIATSNNELIQAPRPNKNYRKELKLRDRNLSRKKLKSKNRQKTKLLNAKFKRHLAQIRQNFLHTTSARIVKSSALVCAETLKIDQMKKNHLTAIAVQDAGWRYLFDFCKYKCKLLGHYFHQINQWLASSKTCNSCGHKKTKLDLNTRKYVCDECGFVCHRDLNAAYNIRDWGFQEVIGYKWGAERASVDVVFDILSSDEISSTRLKQEAACFSGR